MSASNRTPEPASNGMPGRPWYRQFWPWFVIAIPAWGVMSSIITTTVAIRGADEVITEASGRALSRTSWRDGLTAAEVRQALETGMPITLPAETRPDSHDAEVIAQ